MNHWKSVTPQIMRFVRKALKHYKDSCETIIAEAFQLKLVFHHSEPYKGREPYWIVQRIDNGAISILYMLSYYYDGSPFSHDGDSEWVRLKLNAAGSGWAVSWAYMSAHWGACCWGDESKHVAGSDLIYVSNRPVIYVSKNHHANYESEGRCDARTGDDCTSLAFGHDELPFVAEGNIGSRTHPFNLDSGFIGSNSCATTRFPSSSRIGVECYFSNTSSWFAGWSGSDGATPYNTVLLATGY